MNSVPECLHRGGARLLCRIRRTAPSTKAPQATLLPALSSISAQSWKIVSTGKIDSPKNRPIKDSDRQRGETWWGKRGPKVSSLWLHLSVFKLCRSDIRREIETYDHIHLIWIYPHPPLCEARRISDDQLSSLLPWRSSTAAAYPRSSSAGT